MVSLHKVLRGHPGGTVGVGQHFGAILANRGFIPYD